MVKAKALEIRYTLLDCYLVDILNLSEAFGWARIGNCDIKPTDGAAIMPEQGSKIMLRYGVMMTTFYCFLVNHPSEYRKTLSKINMFNSNTTL